MKTQALFALVTLGLAAGCGSSSESTPAPLAPTTDTPAATEPPPAVVDDTPKVDHGAPSTTYPAFTPDIGQLQMNGGPVLSTPKIVTVTWPGETHVTELESLGDLIGQGPYWKEVTSEYGVGPAVSGPENHVRLSDAKPASLSDQQLEQLIQSRLSTTASDPTQAWPAPTGNEVYILYLPRGTNLMLDGQGACQQGIGGYHSNLKVNGKDVAYAIVPQCGSQFDDVTIAASHELAEAVTDPYPQTRPALVGFDADHLSWELFQQFQSENGDACEFYRDSALGPQADLPFTTQRQWSNKSAAAGHDPCVPAGKATYFNTTPIKTEDVTVDLSQFGGDSETATKGYKIPVGETKTIAIGLYSDAAKKPWKLKAIEGGITGTSQKGKYDLELDVQQGENGQIAYLTVTVNAAGRIGGGIVSIVSTDENGVSHYAPILLSTPPAKK